MKKIKQGDEVAVLIGKDKGRRGTVLEVLDNNKVLVEGINVVKKHTKANPNAGVEGGIIDKTMPIDISNVMIWNPEKNRADRVGCKIDKDGEKARIFRSTGAVVDL